MTRAYYDSTATPPVSPAFSAYWSDSSQGVRRVLNFTKASSAMTTLTRNDQASTTNHLRTLAAQFVSEPLAAGVFSGTFKGQIRARESGAAANMHSDIVVRVVSNDGSTFRTPEVYAGSNDTTAGNPVSEFVTVATLTNRQMPRGGALSVGTPTIQSQDRLVVEIGVNAHNISATVFTFEFRVGDNSGSDLPEDETDTNDFAPWIDFSTSLSLYVAPTAMPIFRRMKTRLRR